MSPFHDPLFLICTFNWHFYNYWGFFLCVFIIFFYFHHFSFVVLPHLCGHWVFIICPFHPICVDLCRLFQSMVNKQYYICGIYFHFFIIPPSNNTLPCAFVVSSLFMYSKTIVGRGDENFVNSMTLAYPFDVIVELKINHEFKSQPRDTKMEPHHRATKNPRNDLTMEGINVFY